MEVHGRPLLRWALDQCVACEDVTHVVVVAPAAWLTQARDVSAVEPVRHDAGPSGRVRIDVVVGGADRRASVAAGLAALSDDDGLVLVHDAARAFAPPSLFARVVGALRHGHGAVVPGLPVVDTIKEIDDSGRVLRTVERTSLRAVQTPQGFVREILVHAHGENLDAPVTDDAGLVEMTGAPIHVVDGEPWAHKITTPEDLETAARRLAGVEAQA